MPSAAASLKPAFAREGRPFFGRIEAVLVESPAEFEFDGAILREHARDAWTWMVRDLAPGLLDPEADERDPATLHALDAALPDLLDRARRALATGTRNIETERRLKVQLGGDDRLRRLPFVLEALRCRHLIDKSVVFGRTANGHDEAALFAALQTMPRNDPKAFALVMQAVVGQTAVPSRLTAAAIRVAGTNAEVGLQRADFGPLVDAMLAHAQNQIWPLGQTGPFADIDLVCRAIERFHRLIRAVNGYVEIGRGSRWSVVVAGLIKAMSERLEPRLRDVVPEINRALRRYRDGADQLDRDQLLAARNAMYVLAAVRACRDPSPSTPSSIRPGRRWGRRWKSTSSATSNCCAPTGRRGRRRTARRRHQMAELRFDSEYADVLRRAGRPPRAASRRGPALRQCALPRRALFAKMALYRRRTLPMVSGPLCSGCSPLL